MFNGNNFYLLNSTVVSIIMLLIMITILIVVQNASLPCQVSKEFWMFCCRSQFFILGTKSWATSTTASPKIKMFGTVDVVYNLMVCTTELHQLQHLHTGYHTVPFDWTAGIIFFMASNSCVWGLRKSAFVTVWTATTCCSKENRNEICQTGKVTYEVFIYIMDIKCHFCMGTR